MPVQVRCAENNQRFRVVPRLVRAKLDLDVVQSGEVCSNAWAYHYLHLDGSSAGEAPDAGAADGGGVGKDETQGVDGSGVGGHRRRSLRKLAEAAAPAVAVSASSSHSTTHVRYALQIFEGEPFAIAFRLHNPPAFASKNLKLLLFEDLDNQNPHRGSSIFHVNGELCDLSLAEALYVGIFGSNGCAAYSLTLHEFEGACGSGGSSASVHDA